VDGERVVGGGQKEGQEREAMLPMVESSRIEVIHCATSGVCGGEPAGCKGAGEVGMVCGGCKSTEWSWDENDAPRQRVRDQRAKRKRHLPRACCRRNQGGDSLRTIDTFNPPHACKTSSSSLLFFRLMIPLNNFDFGNS
jgi:hypothetical protein